MQHIKLPIITTNSRSRPTANDTINTGPAPAHTNTYIDCKTYPFIAQGQACNSIHQVDCNIITVFVWTNRGIPLNQCLFVFTRTECNCLRVHEKSIPSLGEENRAQEEKILAVMCKLWSLKGQAYCIYRHTQKHMTYEDTGKKMHCTFR